MSNIFYNIRQALKQINRNKGMSFASVFAITAMMLILGMFFIVTVNVNLFTEMIKEDYDQIEIFLEDDLERPQKEEILSTLEHTDNVTSVSYRSKDDAFNIMKKRWGESGYLLDSLGENPLPDSFLVTIGVLEKSEEVTQAALEIEGVEDVKFYQETVEKLTKVTNFIQIAALVIMAFLIIVSVVVVSNTIKLTVFAREKEISIMKYIGATNWFIRGPFLVEGVIMGVVASLISAGITYFVYTQVESVIGMQVMTILSTPLVPATYLAKNLILIFLAMGVSIGAGGSIISMRRFLDTKKKKN